MPHITVMIGADGPVIDLGVADGPVIDLGVAAGPPHLKSQ